MSRIVRSITSLILAMLFFTQAAVSQTEAVGERAPIDICSSFTESANDTNKRNENFAPKFFLKNNTSVDCEIKTYATEVYLVESPKFTRSYVEKIVSPRFRMAVCLNSSWDVAFKEGWKTSMSVYSYDDKFIWSIELDSIEDCLGS